MFYLLLIFLSLYIVHEITLKVKSLINSYFENGFNRPCSSLEWPCI